MLLRKIKKKGYDGIVYNNEIEAVSGKSYIAFDSEQVFRQESDNKYSLSEIYFDIPYSEKRQLQEYIMQKNNSSDVLDSFDCKEIGNNFYIWKNNSKTDYTIISMTEIDGNEDLIDFMRGDVKNGTFGKGKGLRKNVAWYNERYGTRHRGSIADTDG